MKKRQKSSSHASAIQVVFSLTLICISVVLAIAAAQHTPLNSQSWKTNNAPPSRAVGIAVPLTPSNTALTRTLNVAEHNLTIHYPDSWSIGPKRFSNMQELVNVSADKQDKLAVSARIKIRHQTRLDHADALNELVEISKETKAAATVLNIGGWPAIQRASIEDRPEPDEAPRFWDPYMVRVTTAIAAGNFVTRIDAILPSDADAKMIGDAIAVARSVAFSQQAEAKQTESDLNGLRNKTAAAAARSTSTAGPTTAPKAQPKPQDQSNATQGQQQVPASSVSNSPDTGASRVFNGGNGELEIITSADGKTVIISRQNNWITSKDGGQTFPFSGALNFGDGDPSLAQGKSGNYYLAGIRTSGGGCTFNGVDPNAATHLFGYTCTGFRRSSDGGQTFPILGNAVVCPNDNPSTPGAVTDQCFPDQEHIAADRFNAGSGGDQVYNTWRNFDNTDQDPGLVCSQDSGANWTAPVDVDSGVIPRIGVGQDGFVYVVYRSGGNIRLNKYSSCANGLASQPGFPLTITAVTDVTCPVPGLDRCNNGNNLSSIMVAVDDTNPNHVYVAYANEIGTGNDDIIVRDSIDGGANWPGPRFVRVNTAIPGVRFMPWISATTGSAVVSWYDRRASTPCASPPCAANNDLTDYYAATARLDSGGNLVAGNEIKLTDAGDPQCAGAKTSGSAASWPCQARSQNDSESCSAQPQLAGVCCDNTQPGCPGSQQACDYSSGPACPSGETCNGGSGCPKYGDYNGNAAAAGKMFIAWASGVPPSGIAASGNIDVFFASKLVGDVPVASVPGPVNFADTCVGSTSTSTLHVCDTGNANLEVNSITSSDPQFAVTAPSSGYPLVISPDFCFPFQATFTPTSTGAKTTTFTISTNDPANASLAVQGKGKGGTSALKITGSSDFGNLCTDGTSEKTIQICNTGSCDLNVTSVAFSPACPDFTLVNSPFPATVSHDSCLNVTIRFTPTSVGAKTCTLVVDSDDPTNPTLNIPVTGSSTTAAIAVPADAIFPPTVELPVGGCPFDAAFPITNTGSCRVKVTDISFTGDFPGDYALPGMPTLPASIEAGHVLGDGAMFLRFSPRGVDRARQATINITYESDPVTGATSTISRNLCGEGVKSGLRVLARKAGVPLNKVKQIKLLRLATTKPHNRPRYITQDVANNVSLKTVSGVSPCASFQYHREYGTSTNLVQLQPGFYQVSITAVINGKTRTRTRGFNLDTCTFNKEILVNF